MNQHSTTSRNGLFFACLWAAALGAGAAAQGEPPAGTKPAPDPARTTEVSGVQDPATQETEAQRIARLKAELAELQRQLRDLERLRESGGMVGRVKWKLGTQTREVPVTTPKQAAPVVRSERRTFTDGELADLAPDTMFTVNGTPVSMREFEALLESVKNYTPDPEAARRKTMEALILHAAAKGHDPKVAAGNRQRLQAVVNRILEMSPFAKECKEISECPSADQGGQLGELSVNDRDPLFMQAALALETGDRSPIVESTEGFHYIECLHRNPKMDINAKVNVRHVMVKFTPDTDEVLARTRKGLVALAFRDSSDMEYAPKPESTKDAGEQGQDSDKKR